MDDIWGEIMDGLDWDAVDRDVEKMREEEAASDAIKAYFASDEFDYKRGYIRKVRRSRPDITDPLVIDFATEQMLESHESGVELDVDDAIRFVRDKKPITKDEIFKMFSSLPPSGKSFADIIDADFDDGKYGTVKSPEARKKAEWMTRYAEIVGRNKDVLILALPTFNMHDDWTYVKLAFFSEDLNAAEKYALESLIKTADRSGMEEQYGVAVAFFQIFNIWSDFK